MKAAVLAVCTMILFAPLSLADDGAISGIGGTVALLDEHPSVQMVSEEVNIKLGYDATTVACKFVFKNTGEATTVKMGFPESKSGLGAFRGFRTFVDGRPVVAIPTEWDSPAPEISSRRWWVKEVPFAENQTRVVENFYSVPPGSDISRTRWFNYILTTGKSWQGPIGRAEITVDTSAMRGCQTINASPEGYERDGDKITWTFTDFEPSRDIHVDWWEGYTSVLVDGTQRDWAMADMRFYPLYPRLRVGVLMVPAGALPSALGNGVSVSPKGRSLNVSCGEKTVHLTAGSAKAGVNGTVIALPRPVEFRYSRFVVPLAAITRALGATVWFDPETKKTHITWSDMVREYCNFVVDGREMHWRPSEYYAPCPAWIDKGVLMVPVGYLRRLVQPGLTWSYADGIVTMTDGAKTLRLTVGSTSADVDGAPLELPRAPEIRQSTCMLPLAPVARALGATVWFDPETKKTHITRPGKGKETGS